MTFRKLAYSVALLSFVRSSIAVDDIFGLRQNIYIPRCAHACRITIQESPLECSYKGTTAAQCYASDDPYLETLAFCISSHCKNESNAAIDIFWSKYVVGWELATPQPIFTYKTALSHAGQPNSILKYGKLLERVSIVAPTEYTLGYASLTDWNDSEEYHTKYA
jgi:hypothetical protein